jgi:hypothetical protein
MPDGTRLEVKEKGTMWRIGGWSIPKTATSKAIQIMILELNLKILRNYPCSSPVES